jgi:hypothetical protein
LQVYVLISKKYPFWQSPHLSVPLVSLSQMAQLESEQVLQVCVAASRYPVGHKNWHYWVARFSL